MFFKSADIDVKILSVIEMGWQRVNARAGYRPFHTLSFRLLGDAVFFSQGEEVLRTQQEEIVFVPAGYDFSKQAGQGRILAIHFASDSELPTQILRFSPQNPDRFRKDFLKLHSIWVQKAPGYEYEAKILLYRMILNIETQWSESQNAPGSRRLSGIVEYINEHYADSDFSVTELSRMAGMSDTYLRKLFVTEHSMTPQKYVNQLRLSKATELLRSGYYSVSEISTRCGFNNSNYFSAFIKKQTGMSPVAYRKQLLSQLPTPQQIPI